MTAICVHAFVSGKVQGVFYRGATQQQAQRLSVTGWAKNLSDGRVEVLLCGEEAAVYEIESWLHEGPPRAVVDSVKSEVVSWQAIDDFSVL
jgi:acylphosphatase